jgi:hypothetical protein
MQAMNAGLDWQNVVQHGKSCVHRRRREANCTEAAPDFDPAQVSELCFDLRRRQYFCEGGIERFGGDLSKDSDLNVLEVKNLQEEAAKVGKRLRDSFGMRAGS